MCRAERGSPDTEHRDMAKSSSLAGATAAALLAAPVLVPHRSQALPSTLFHLPPWLSPPVPGPGPPHGRPAQQEGESEAIATGWPLISGPNDRGRRQGLTSIHAPSLSVAPVIS
ncbi:hypothetical protein CDD83_2370 [Cordyceps sp. RAO-2017]|nr:hypothetical protein CDD83_2370 [Cordyceps sp. RAO-2017]